MDWGLGQDTSGDSAGSSLGEVPVASWLEAAWGRQVGALSAHAGFGTPFGIGGFEESGTILSA
jgi:hypothetical protein